MVTLGWKSNQNAGGGFLGVGGASGAPRSGSAISLGLAPVRYTITTILYRNQYQQPRG